MIVRTMTIQLVDNWFTIMTIFSNENINDHHSWTMIIIGELDHIGAANINIVSIFVHHNISEY